MLRISLYPPLVASDPSQHFLFLSCRSAKAHETNENPLAEPLTRYDLLSGTTNCHMTQSSETPCAELFQIQTLHSAQSFVTKEASGQQAQYDAYAAYE